MGELIKKGVKHHVHLIVTRLPSKQDAKSLERALKAVAKEWGGRSSTKRKPKK